MNGKVLPSKEQSEVTLEDVRLLWPNFRGAATKFNSAGGKRETWIEVPDEAVPLLADLGYPVKFREGREEGDPGYYTLALAVNMTPPEPIRPPVIAMVNHRGRTLLDEETVELLDFADVVSVDVTITPSDWEVGDNKGRKAYIKELYATINESRLASKYADVPVVGGN